MIFSVVSTIICGKIYKRNFGRSTKPDWNITAGLNFKVTNEKYPPECIEIPSEELDLSGFLFGGKNTKGLVVFCHGMGGGTELYLPEICFDY